MTDKLIFGSQKVYRTIRNAGVSDPRENFR